MEFIKFLKPLYIFVTYTPARLLNAALRISSFLLSPARAIIKKVHELHVRCNDFNGLDIGII